MTELYPIILSVVMSVFATLLALFLYSNLKKSQYDRGENKAILDEIRSSFEQQMYRINEKLLQSEERWKDLNHLLLRSEYFKDKDSLLNKSPKIGLNNFLKANGITKEDLIVDNDMIFVLTPFNEMFQKDYIKIKMICDEVGFKCYRGDEKYSKSDIFSEILKYIVKSRLIIANINGRNPNVLYELGIAQALDKPVILLSKAPDELPIDIKSKRFIIYKSSEELRSKLSTELIKILKDKNRT